LPSQVEGLIARASVCQAFADMHFARLSADPSSRLDPEELFFGPKKFTSANHYGKYYFLGPGPR
jgi:hypothetical protein